MAFFTYQQRPKNSYFFEQKVSLPDKKFTICKDYYACYKNTLDTIEMIISDKREKYCLPFSGGADSWFLLLCFLKLVEQKKADITQLQIIIGNFKINGQSTVPEFDNTVQELESLDLRYNVMDVNVDEKLFNNLREISVNESEPMIEKVLQYYVFNNSGYVNLIPEGGPIVNRKPWMKDEKKDFKKYIYHSALNYERLPNRVCIFQHNRKIFESWLIQENFDFQNIPLTKEQFDLMPAYYQNFVKWLRYHWRFKLYATPFPEYKHKFFYKIQSFTNAMQNCRHYMAMSTNLKKLYERAPKQINHEEFMWDTIGYYAHSWTEFEIDNDSN